MDPAGVGAVRLRKRNAQRIDMLGQHDQVDGVGHRYPAPHRRPWSAQWATSKSCPILGVAEKGLLSAVAALGDVMWEARKEIASKRSSARPIAAAPCGQFGALSP